MHPLASPNDQPLTSGTSQLMKARTPDSADSRTARPSGWREVRELPRGARKKSALRGSQRPKEGGVRNLSRLCGRESAERDFTSYLASQLHRPAGGIPDDSLTRSRHDPMR